jgi:DNA invertase Pin-like site-specific DNA recombinase
MQGTIAASHERVSTFVQAQRGHSMGAQSQDVEAFAVAQGWELPEHLRLRDGETQNASGASWNLPALNRMLDAA